MLRTFVKGFSVLLSFCNYHKMDLQGGYTTGPAELVQLLRQKSRPYLFSNSCPPPIVASASKVRVK